MPALRRTWRWCSARQGALVRPASSSRRRGQDVDWVLGVGGRGRRRSRCVYQLPRDVRGPGAMTGAARPSPSSSRPTGEGLAFGVVSVKEREGASAITGGVSMLARQIEHSCWRRWTASNSRRAKACLKPPECMSWRVVARNLAISCQSLWRVRSGDVPGGVCAVRLLRGHGVWRGMI